MALLNALENPIISTSAHLLDDDGNAPTLGMERVNLFDELDKLVDVIVDNGTEPAVEVSTILDLTSEEPVMVRKGLGWEAVMNWATPIGNL
jgi:tRNA A37 threonylcarbamoyladenosine synthetase subunit TsaC/SUA5/YrdC